MHLFAGRLLFAGTLELSLPLEVHLLSLSIAGCPRSSFEAQQRIGTWETTNPIHSSMPTPPRFTPSPHSKY